MAKKEFMNNLILDLSLRSFIILGPDVLHIKVLVFIYTILCFFLGYESGGKYPSFEKRSPTLSLVCPSGLSQLDCYQELANVWMRFLMRKQQKRSSYGFLYKIYA